MKGTTDCIGPSDDWLGFPETFPRGLPLVQVREDYAVDKARVRMSANAQQRALLIYTMLHKARAKLATLNVLYRKDITAPQVERTLRLVGWWEHRWRLVPPRLAMRVARGVQA